MIRIILEGLLVVFLLALVWAVWERAVEKDKERKAWKKWSDEQSRRSWK